MGNRSCKRGRPFQCFTFQSDISSGFLLLSFIRLRFSPVSTLPRVLVRKGFGVFIIFFYCNFWVDHACFSFSNMLNDILRFLNIKSVLHSYDAPYLGYIFLFMYCWINFLKNVNNFCIYVLRGIRPQFSYRVMTFSGFGSRYLVSGLTELFLPL